MSRCPEELLESRSVELSEEERRMLADHLAECPVCAMEVELPKAVRRAERSVDPALVASAVLAAEGRIAEQARISRRRTRVQVGIAAALVVVAAVAAAHEWAQRGPAPSSSSESVGEKAILASETTPPVSTENVEAPPTVPFAPPGAPAPTASSLTSARTVVSPPPSSAAPDGVSAAVLFARANRARQGGDIDGATDGYRKLVRRFPQSEEAAVAHVSLGRLLLDRRGDGAGALAEFDAYLANPRQGEIRESSLIGRARALGMLARPDDERRAWEVLLAEYPDSLYAGRARARLGELR